jgi:hypothetical protein
MPLLLPLRLLLGRRVGKRPAADAGDEVQPQPPQLLARGGQQPLAEGTGHADTEMSDTGRRADTELSDTELERQLDHSLRLRARHTARTAAAAAAAAAHKALDDEPGDGYDPNGYDPSGYDPSGYDLGGNDPSGYDPNDEDAAAAAADEAARHSDDEPDDDAAPHHHHHHHQPHQHQHQHQRHMREVSAPRRQELRSRVGSLCARALTSSAAEARALEAKALGLLRTLELTSTELLLTGAQLDVIALVLVDTAGVLLPEGLRREVHARCKLEQYHHDALKGAFA